MSLRYKITCSSTIFFRSTRPFKSRLREATSASSSSSDSSKDMKIPGSLNLIAPLIKKSSPQRVFPEPALPQTKVVLFFGSPPSAFNAGRALQYLITFRSLCFLGNFMHKKRSLSCESFRLAKVIFPPTSVSTSSPEEMKFVFSPLQFTRPLTHADSHSRVKKLMFVKRKSTNL